jgi:hypothetical protein
MDMECRLSVAIGIASSEFESFCRQGYSLSHLVRTKSLPTDTALVQFKLEVIGASSSEIARLEFRPAPRDHCFIALRLYETDLDVGLKELGQIICALLFCDFVVYLGQIGYVVGDVSEIDDARKQFLGELRQLDTRIPEHLSELKSKRQAQMSQLPPGTHPALELIYNGIRNLVEIADEGTANEIVDTIAWYLKAYSEFPTLVTDGKASAKNPIMDLQKGRPGRPRNEAYDEAFASLSSGKMDFKGAFQLFCKKEGIVKPDKGVRYAFKAAMKRRQKDI